MLVIGAHDGRKSQGRRITRCFGTDDVAESGRVAVFFDQGALETRPSTISIVTSMYSASNALRSPSLHGNIGAF